MFTVNDEDAAAIRAAFRQGGEFAAAVELRRRFPLIKDNACTAPGFLDTRVLLCGDLRQRAIPSDACVVGTAQAVLLDQPLRVVARDEGADGVTHVVDGLVDATVHDLLLEGAEEALDHPVRFRFTDEGVARGDAPEADLPVKVLGQKSAAVIVTQREAAGGAGADPSERGANRHADRLRSGVAVAALDNIPA